MKRSLILIFMLLFLFLQTSAIADTFPPKVGICLYKANLLIQKKETTKAIATLQEFLAKQFQVDKKEAAKQGYDHYHIYFLLGNCFLMLDQQKSNPSYVKKACKAYEATVKKQNDFSAAWLNLARCYYRIDKMKKASSSFLKGYETSKEKKAAHLYYASVCSIYTKDYKKALSIFKTLLKNHPDSITLEYKETLVNIYFSLDQHKKTLPWVEELARKFTGNKKKKWQEILLYQYLTLKMDKKALDYARFLTRSHPTEPKWWKALSHIYLQRNLLEQGLSSLIIYSFISPLTSRETTLLGDLYLACDIPLKAAKAYEACLEYEEDSKEIQKKILQITRSYISGCEKEIALKWIEKGLAIKQDPDLLRIKADILFARKEYKKAYTTYGQLSKFKKHKGLCHLMMGYAAWNEEETQKAKTQFIKASKFKKQRKSAQKALAQIKKIAGDP